jgi:predicted HTH transcriptional regulator
MLYSSVIAKQNKIESYITIQDKVETRKEMVLDALIKLGSATANEITAYLYQIGKIPSYTTRFTSPRIRELVIDGKVEESGRRKDAVSNRVITTYRVIDSDATELLIPIDLKRPSLSNGQEITLQLMKEVGKATERELVDILLSRKMIPINDKNYVHPYLYHLVEDGFVEIVGKKVDKVTGKRCSVYEYIK